LTKAATELQNPYYDGTLLIAGDMNHYPGPRSADISFRKKSDLVAVDLGGKFTWPSKDAGFLESKLGRFYSGQLDDVLYRGNIAPVKVEVMDAMSDHKAIKVTFKLR
jgi:endonuclease/exonuclease/phosphatase (EEP) superfamily protein YafD